MAIFNQGKKFFIYGIINFAITNVVLQIMLLFTNAWASTIFSQITNFLIGYQLYSKYVFNIISYKKSVLFKYFLLAFILFFTNAKLIILISRDYSISKNLAAFIVVPILVVFSFLSQKFLIFRK